MSVFETESPFGFINVCNKMLVVYSKIGYMRIVKMLRLEYNIVVHSYII